MSRFEFFYTFFIFFRETGTFCDSFHIKKIDLIYVRENVFIWQRKWNLNYQDLISYLRKAFKLTRTLQVGPGWLSANIANNTARLCAERTCSSSWDSFLMLSISGLTTGFSFSGRQCKLAHAPANAACTLLITSIVSLFSIYKYRRVTTLWTLTSSLNRRTLKHRAETSSEAYRSASPGARSKIVWKSARLEKCNI